MEYRVEIAPDAYDEIDRVFEWIAKESPSAAADWLNGLFERLHSLATHPRRFPIAPENDVFEDEIRQLLHGTKHHAYRVLFAVAGSTVYIVHVRHAARRYLQADSSE